MEDLCEQTHTKHYERYRRNRLEQVGFCDVDSDNNKPVSFQQNYEAMRANFLAKLQRYEDELRQRFVLRVKEKENELRAIEKEVNYYSIIDWTCNLQQAQISINFSFGFVCIFFRCWKSTPN